MSEIRYTPPAAASGPTGSGAAGQVTFWSAATVLTGSNNLFWNNTNARLGIGTNAPAQALDVIGTVQSSGDYIFSSYNRSFGNSSFPALNIYSSNYRLAQNIYSAGSTNGLSFNNNGGSLQMRIFDNGNVTINSSVDAGYKLDVYGTLRVLSGNGSRIEGGGTFTATGFCNFNGANQAVPGTNCTVLNAQSSASIGFVGAADSSAILHVASTTKGFLPPKMTNAQRTAISSPAIGLIVYCTDAVEGLYIYKSTGWTFII